MEKKKRLIAHMLSVLMILSAVGAGIAAVGTAESYADSGIVFTHPGGYLMDLENVSNTPPAPTDDDYVTYNGEVYNWNRQFGAFMKGNEFLIDDTYDGTYIDRKWVESYTDFVAGGTYHFKYELRDYDGENPVYSEPVEVKIKGETPLGEASISFTPVKPLTCNRQDAKTMQSSAIDTNFLSKAGNKFTLTMGDVSTDYTCDANGIFVNEDNTESLDEVTNDYTLHSSWKEGETFEGETAVIYFYILINGKKVETTIPVTLTGEAPQQKTVKAVAFEAAEAYEVKKSEVSESEPPQPKNGDKITLTFTDDSTKEYIYDENGEEGADFYNEDDYVGMYGNLDRYWNEGQSFNVGDTPTFYFYLDNDEVKSNDVQAKIIADPEPPAEKTAKSIQFVHDGAYTVKAAADDEGNTPVTPAEVDGDKLIVTYTDGTTDTFIYKASEGSFYREDNMDIDGAFGIVSGDPSSLKKEWKPNQSFTAGSTCYFTYKIADLVTQDIPVSIEGTDPGNNPGGGGSGGGGGSDTDVTDPVKTVVDEINALPISITTNDKSAIKKARADYNALTPEQKKDERLTETLLKKLSDAEEALAAAEKEAEQEARKHQMGEDGTALGKGASAEAAEAAILGMTSDADPAGSKIMPLKAKSVKQTKKSVKLQWSRPSDAVKYVVYGNKCGKGNKMKKIKTTAKAAINFKKIAGKKVRKNTSYKFIVVALDAENNVVSTSKVVHAVTKSAKKSNPTKLKVKTPKKLKKTLVAGKSFKIKSKVSKLKGKKVYLHVAKKYKGLRYESSNPAVANVSKTGKVTAVSSGTAKIIVYTQNGIYKTVNVTVK